MARMNYGSGDTVGYQDGRQHCAAPGLADGGSRNKRLHAEAYRRKIFEQLGRADPPPPPRGAPTIALMAGRGDRKAPMWSHNEVLMDESHPSLGTAREAAEAPAVEASRNAPTPTPQLRTTEEEMSFLVSNIQGMEKKVFEILLNQKSLKRIVETKLCDLDVKGP
ncbi:hypothetical protein D1007_38116 [Hordeum vulgare]|nr:hypothetical protein D1007_38116 [Hordeum vulgare]